MADGRNRNAKQFCEGSILAGAESSFEGNNAIDQYISQMSQGIRDNNVDKTEKIPFRLS